MKAAGILVTVAVAASALPGGAAGDPFGGPGGHFLVAQELPGSAIATPGRCASHFGLAEAPVDVVREATLVAPVTDAATARLDFDAAAGGGVIGSASVCYRAPDGDRERSALAVLELESGADHLLLEAVGVCRDYPGPLGSTVLFQSCSLHITGPKAEGVRSGTITSGGLVPKGAPADSVKPNTWTVFVVRD